MMHAFDTNQECNKPDVSPQYRSLIFSIDALMNKLILNTQKTPKPLLIENNDFFSVQSIGESASISAKSNRRMNIAIVDDDKSSGIAISALVSEFNFNVEHFQNIKELNKRLFSVGVAGLAQNESLPHAVNQADQALYASKEDVRNKITIFEETREQ
jgi:GGDEF domain-containing protein